MKDHWTDFEKYVFEKLEKMDHRLTLLEGKALVFGGIAGLIASALMKVFS